MVTRGPLTTIALFQSENASHVFDNWLTNGLKQSFAC